jgi:hypothetical protein
MFMLICCSLSDIPAGSGHFHLDPLFLNQGFIQMKHYRGGYPPSVCWAMFFENGENAQNAFWGLLKAGNCQ